MENILNFMCDHYVMFLTISILLIFALIGYFVDVKRRNDNPYKIDKQEEINLDSLEVRENIALQDVLNKNKNIGTVANGINSMPTETIETLDVNQNNAQ